jgi:hypothetical protein
MTVSMWIPLEDYLTGWAENLFPRPDLGGLAVTGHSTRVTDGIGTSVLSLELAQDLTLALPGVDVVTAQLLQAEHGSGLTVEVDWTGPFRVRVLDLGADLVIDSPFLVQVSGDPGEWVPVLQPDGSRKPASVGFTAGVAELDGFGGITFSSDVSLSVPPLMLGDTGFVIQVTGARLSFSGEEPPPDTAVEGFRGLLFDSAVLHFPDGLDAPNALESIEVTDGAIGTGGFSGAFTGSWDTQWDGATPAGDGAGSLLGFAFGLDSLQLQVQQDAVTGAALSGGLAVPFFDQVLTVAVSVDDAGAFTVTVTGTPDSPPQPSYGSPVTPTTPAIVTLTVPGVGTLRVDALGLVRDGDGTGLLLSGELDLQVGAPALSWPTIEVQDLRIAPDGTVHVPGGWIDLQQPVALDLYGFTMEITRVGFGTEDDGRRWVGLDGAVRLTELLPAGASVRGLRVTWDPAHPGVPQLTLDGLSVGFAVPGAVDFGGEVALADDPDTGAKLFTGALRLGLDALDIGLDAGITIGHDGADVYVLVHLGVDLPIPLGATGAALYGLDGLLALEMAPKGVRRGLVRLVHADLPPVQHHQAGQVGTRTRYVGGRRGGEHRHPPGRRLLGEHTGAADRGAARAGPAAAGQRGPVQAPARARRRRAGRDPGHARRAGRTRQHLAARHRRHVEPARGDRDRRGHRGVLRLRPPGRLASVDRPGHPRHRPDPRRHPRAVPRRRLAHARRRRSRHRPESGLGRPVGVRPRPDRAERLDRRHGHVDPASSAVVRDAGPWRPG